MVTFLEILLLLKQHNTTLELHIDNLIKKQKRFQDPKCKGRGSKLTFFQKQQ